MQGMWSFQRSQAKTNLNLRHDDGIIRRSRNQVSSDAGHCMVSQTCHCHGSLSGRVANESKLTSSESLFRAFTVDSRCTLREARALFALTTPLDSRQCSSYRKSILTIWHVFSETRQFFSLQRIFGMGFFVRLFVTNTTHFTNFFYVIFLIIIYNYIFYEFHLTNIKYAIHFFLKLKPLSPLINDTWRYRRYVNQHISQFRRPPPPRRS